MGSTLNRVRVQLVLVVDDRVVRLPCLTLETLVRLLSEETRLISPYDNMRAENERTPR